MSTEPRFLTHSSSYNINLPNAALPPQSDEKPPEIINFKLDVQGQIFWNEQPVENKQALESLFMTVAKKSEQ
jgi:biopolymer transport protein ExbD